MDLIELKEQRATGLDVIRFQEEGPSLWWLEIFATYLSH